MVGAHAHLNQYGGAPRALTEIRERSVCTLAVSMEVASFRETQRIARGEPYALPDFGVHPWEAHRFLAEIDALADPIVGGAAYIPLREKPGPTWRFGEEYHEYCRNVPRLSSG